MLNAPSILRVYVDDKPIASEAKVEGALGAACGQREICLIREAIGFLWENEPASAVTLARYRKVALRLKNILEEYGISDIIETTAQAKACDEQCLMRPL